MAKYRKRVVEVEAVRYDGANHDEVVRFAGEAPTVTHGRTRALGIGTEGGLRWLDPGDWVLRNEDGLCSVCKPVEFKATYEPCKED